MLRSQLLQNEEYMAPLMNRSRTPLAAIWSVAAICIAGSASAQSGQIRVNQLGFYPGGPKAAIVVDAPATTFHVTTSDLQDTVFTGALSAEKLWTPSLERVRLADFSAMDTPGTYVVAVPGLGESHEFAVAAGVHEDLAIGSVKAYYFMRASTALRPEYAGRWSRPAGHPDTAVRVHGSAANEARPEGTTVAAARGWYDAGDYGKYVVNSGITTGTLLMLYEHYPGYFGVLETGIPESGDAVPDLLDEVLWNVRWMMAMQDPTDGGVYHKLTTPNFEGAVMPSQATQPRYVVQKSTPAALDLAAVSAIAARVIDPFSADLPGLADSLLSAAFAAWNWAQFNPYEPYIQSEVNAAFDPDINTGEYGDRDFFDEFRWAASELFITTGQDSFVVMYPPRTDDLTVPGWPDVGTMSVLSLVHHRESVAATIDTAAAILGLRRLANQLVEARRNSAYNVVMGSGASDFYWGSNGLAANEAIILLNAYRATSDERHLHSAISNLDYLLGRNATGYSFVTGNGARTPHHPHHRPSQADGIPDPIPGMLVGGPNLAQEDGCDYPSDVPARSYLDEWCSYASNEIAINWNAALAYVAGAIEATMSETGRPVSNESAGTLQRSVRSSSMQAFPSPASGRATLRLVLDQSGPVALEIYDMLGREVARVDAGYLQDGVHDVAVDTAALAAGVYVIRAREARAVQSARLIIAR